MKNTKTHQKINRGPGHLEKIVSNETCLHCAEDGPGIKPKGRKRPQEAQDGRERPEDGPKMAPRLLQEASKATSRWLPDASKIDFVLTSSGVAAKSSPRGPKDPPKRPPDPPRTPPGGPPEAYGNPPGCQNQ